MIDLYALTSPNVVRVFIALEELGLPYNVIPVDVWAGEQFKPEYIKINPNSKVPAITDHEGPGGKPITVFESAAILMYLANKTGKLMPKEGAARYECMEWLIMQVTTLGPFSGQAVHFTRFAPSGNDYAVSRYKTEVNRIYDVLENRLAASKYLGGADYSVADIAAYPWSRAAGMMGVNLEARPHVQKWAAEIAERAPVKAALEKVGKITSVRETATEDNKDRMFGRGKYARVA